MKRINLLSLLVTALCLLVEQVTGQTPGSLKWQYALDGSTYSSTPAIATDGTVYIGGKASLFAVNSNGTKKWEFSLSSEPTSPVIAESNDIYIATKNGYLHSVSPAGTINWKCDIYKDASANSSFFDGSPSIGYDGTIYIASEDHYLYAINPNGSVKWKANIGMNSGSSPAISSNGVIYIGSRNDSLYAFTTDGNLIWKIGSVVKGDLSTGKWFGSPSIDANGDIYVGNNDTYLYAISPSGTIKWLYKTSYTIDELTSPVIDAEGKIILGSNDTLYAFNSDGTLNWYYNCYLYDNFEGSALIGSDGTIYAAADDSLLAIDKKGKRLWGIDLGLSGQTPAMDENGIVYIGCGYDCESLHAVYSNSSGLAQTVWPKFKKDMKNRGFMLIENGKSNDIALLKVHTGKYAKICGSNIIKAFISNLGVNDQSNFKICYKINDETPVKETFSGLLKSHQSTSYTFSTTWAPNSPKANVLAVWTESDTDEEENNDLLQTIVQSVNTNYTGNWTGTTSKDREVYIHVNGNDEIDTIAVKIAVKLGTSTCLYTFYSGSKVQIINNQFEATLTNPFIFICGESAYPKISGTFTRSAVCSGEVTSFEQCGGFCGSHLTMGTGSTVASVTWSAGNASEYMVTGEIPANCASSETQQILNNPGIYVFPNPVQNTLYIFGAEKETIDVSILSMEGALIKRTKGYGMDQMDLSELIEGAFLVRIITTKTISICKVIKQ